MLYFVVVSSGILHACFVSVYVVCEEGNLGKSRVCEYQYVCECTRAHERVRARVCVCVWYNRENGGHMCHFAEN